MFIFQIQVGIKAAVHEMYVLCEVNVGHERVVDLVTSKLINYNPVILGIRTLSPLMYCVGGFCGTECGNEEFCPFKGVQAGRSDWRETIRPAETIPMTPAWKVITPDSIADEDDSLIGTG